MFRNWWRRLWQKSPISDLRSARENIDSTAENMRMLREAFETGYSMRQGPSLPGDPYRIELTEKGRRIFWGAQNLTAWDCGCIPGKQQWCPVAGEIFAELESEFGKPEIILLRNGNWWLKVRVSSHETQQRARVAVDKATALIDVHLSGPHHVSHEPIR